MNPHGRTCAGLVVSILAVASSGCAGDAVDPAEAERALLTLHEQVLESHRSGDVETWLDLEADTGYVVVARGEIGSSSRDDRRAGRERYLSSTEFTSYRDLQEPIVRVSNGGTLGWVIAQVEAEGRQTRPDGTEADLRFVSAWIELYEKRDDRWLMVGNVSNFRPPPAPEPEE